MRSNADHDGTPLDELAAAITTGAVRLAAATAAWLRLVAEFDRRGGWHGVGIRSCAHWLAWQCGLGSVAAREHVRVARALPGLPRIQAAFSAGRLSYSKVRALTRIAAPDCEAALLDFALSATASQTELFCRAWRRADDADAGASRPTAEDLQSFEHWYDDDGFLTLKIRMPAVEGAALMARIEARAEREARRERAQATKAVAAPRGDPGGGRNGRPPRSRSGAPRTPRSDASANAPPPAASPPSATWSSPGPTVERRRPGDPPRREVVVHVDAAVLADDTAAGRAHVEGGPAITGAQARRILCEATVVAMLEKGREPLAVGRRRRRATKAQWRALLRRDEGCARPGCPETRVERLHAHHMRHWLFGGPTDIDNLVLLCDVDHGLVHEHDLVVSRRDGRLVVTAPDGSRVWGSADAAFVTGLDGAAPDPADGDDPFAGVHPIDTSVGRRPSARARSSDHPQQAEPRHSAAGARPAGGDSVAAAPRSPPCGPGATRRRLAGQAAGPAAGRPQHDGRPPVVRPVGSRVRAGSRLSVAAEAERLDRVLFPDGAPPRPAPQDAPTSGSTWTGRSAS